MAISSSSSVIPDDFFNDPEFWKSQVELIGNPMTSSDQAVNRYPFNVVDNRQHGFNQRFLAPVYGNTVNTSSILDYDFQQQQESQSFFGFGYGSFDCQQEREKERRQERRQDETFSWNTGGFSTVMYSEFVPSNLPPGFRFCPTNKELIVHYLYRKVRNEPLPTNQIPEINLYKYDPEDFKAEFPQNGEDKWYFFTRKIYTSDAEKRAKRSTPNGFWKASTKGKPVAGTGGRHNTLVYYSGSGKGKKTNWIMHEYMLDKPKQGQKLDNWVLCCIYNRKKKEAKHDQEKENCANDQEEKEPPDAIGNQETGDVHPIQESSAPKSGNLMDDLPAASQPGIPNPSLAFSGNESSPESSFMSDMLIELYDAHAISSDYSVPQPLVYCESPFNPLLSESGHLQDIFRL